MQEQKRLPRTAYSLKQGETFVPFTYGQTLTEFTVKSVVSGACLGVLFGAANAYLGLKAGLTISTSIPIAVLTVILFRALASAGKKGSILELNLSQTVGSASSSVASGLLFTVPALYMWAAESPEETGPPAWLEMTLLGIAGGLLGVLAMIPLRRYLIKEEHGKLIYPEGMACAEVLVAATQRGSRASGVFWGIAAGLFFKLITGLKVIADKVVIPLPLKSEFSVSVSPALIGVGYILGPRIATVMVAGSALSFFIIIPTIALYAGGSNVPFLPELQDAGNVKLISEMKTKDIWNIYVRYIGAGAVATGGIFTLIKSIPTMIASFRLGLANLRGGNDDNSGDARLDRDLSFRTVGLFVSGILLVLIFVPGILGELDSIGERALAAVLVAIFAFFFVTVSSRIVGLVGVTSNPTSGMTIATVIGTSLIFYAMGWTDMSGKVTALMVGTIVCTAASIAGDTSQDLKTGFVLGATPRYQQIGELIGVMTSAGVVALVLMVLNATGEGGIGGTDYPAPQGTLMKIVISGVLDQKLPWMLIWIGVAIACVAVLFRVPVLAFAVGVYLPLYTMAAVFVGGMIRWYTTRKQSEDESERRREQGILAGSGFVGGEGLTGVLIAIVVVALASTGGEMWKKTIAEMDALGLSESASAFVNNCLGLLAIAAIGLFLYWQATRKLPSED